MKPECNECGYWDKKKHNRYKCYGGDCPAKKRDDESVFEKLSFTSEEDKVFSKHFNISLKSLCSGSLLRVTRENVLKALESADKKVEEISKQEK